MPAVDLVELLAQMVAVDSRNPALTAGVPGEAVIAALTADFLESHGFDVALVEPTYGRPSVVARLRGKGGGRSLMLNGHYDTVDFGAMAQPITPRVEDGRMYGRGSYDMKGGLAAVLAAGAKLAAGPRLRGGIIIAAVADEEHASIGTEAALAYMKANNLNADAGIVAEPTEQALCVAHKGFVWATIATKGRAAHGSIWEEGIDAIAHMGRVLNALERYDQGLHTRLSHALLGVPSVHASLISGGIGLSTYPPSCELQIERRTVPGETLASVSTELDSLLDALRADRQFQATLTFGLSRSPMEAGHDAPIVAALRAAATAVLGRAPGLVGMSHWTDAALMADAGIPSVLYGPSGDGAHADIEWVDLASVANCSEVYVHVARALCE
jgi:acetylornithine deacetylase